MADALSFRSISWESLEHKYGVQEIPRAPFFTEKEVMDVEPSPTLQENLRRARRSRLINERAKTHRIVDPVLSEVEALRPGKIATLPEVKLEVKGMEGLCGFPDFLISGSVVHKIVPIVAIIEAKKDDIDEGLPQCAGELLVAYLLNQGRLPLVYGCVTNGADWQFLRLDGERKEVQLDEEMYFLNQLPRLLGVLCYIVDRSLQALAAHAQTG